MQNNASRILSETDSMRINKKHGECNLMRMIPLKKQSKRLQRIYYLSKRGTWNGVSPVTRIVQNRKIYDRNRVKQENLKSSDE